MVNSMSPLPEVTVGPPPRPRKCRVELATVRAVIRAVPLVLCVLGCNYFGSGDAPSRDAGDAPADGPLTVPSSICRVDRFPIAHPPPLADLVVTGTAEGYTMLWVSPGAPPQASGMLLSPDHQVVASRTVLGIAQSRLGGIIDTGRALALAIGDGSSVTTLALSRDLATASVEDTIARSVVVHGPYPSDASHVTRVFMSTDDTLLFASSLDDRGRPGRVMATLDLMGPATDVACADGADDVHCAYAQAAFPAGCMATHVQLQPAIAIPRGQVLAGTCTDLRISSGPDSSDSMLVVWTNGGGEVHARYLGAGGVDIERTMPRLGSAPKVQFDGVRFWLAWIDDRDGLQLASFDLTGAIVQYSLSGWGPAGPESYELVRRGNETALVFLSGTGLEFLTICT
jgi:hypothetical protein